MSGFCDSVNVRPQVRVALTHTFAQNANVWGTRLSTLLSVCVGAPGAIRIMVFAEGGHGSLFRGRPL